ncbi:MAG TPA: hypothetical protein VFK41_03140 [Nocardioidaceae bacterium]|nr:hypothetical protein [Nocardioidaceae bacterium]
METGGIEQGLMGGAGAVIVLLLKYLLVDRRTSRASASKTEAEAGDVIDQRWERLADEYGERLEKAEAKVEALTTRVEDLEDALKAEKDQNRALSRLLRSMARWALTLRDEVVRLGGTVPPMPVDVEFALTTLDSGD